LLDAFITHECIVKQSQEGNDIDNRFDQ